jgi:hypothetical protein
LQTEGRRTLPIEEDATVEQTTAKSLVRDYFYMHYLPGQLSPQLIRGSNYLVLLGEHQEELEMLDRLGVPRYRVYCVERREGAMLSLSQRAYFEALGTALYFGQLADFVRYHLHTNQRFLVLHLDVCGSFLLNLDPVLAEILLFAWRNPRTVVATYSSAGRDRSQLPEGVKSLALCQWISPDGTEMLVDNLYGRCQAAGMSKAVSANMVLRHLFWLRSHWERILMGSAALGNLPADQAREWIDRTQAFWQHIKAGVSAPITYGMLRNAVGRFHGTAPDVPGFDIVPREVQTITYRAYGGFYHLGWFAVYRHTEGLRTAREWLTEMADSLTAQPLLFADHDDRALRRLDLKKSPDSDQVIWPQEQMPRHSRAFLIPKVAGQFSPGENVGRAVCLKEEVQILKDNSRKQEKSASGTMGPAAEDAGSTVVPENPSVLRPETGAKDLDDIATIRRLAWKGWSAQQIIPLLKNPMPKATVAAHIAVARRIRKR